MELKVLFWFFTIVCAGFGAYLGSYLKKKGENLATHEDFKRLLKEAEATTEATKGIESRISNDVWNSQRLWEMKRDAVFAISQAIQRVDDALIAFKVQAEKIQKPGDPPDAWKIGAGEAVNAYHRLMSEFDEKRAIVMIVCSKELAMAVMKTALNFRDSAEFLFEKNVEGYDGLQPELRKSLARTNELAQKELGIVGSV